MNRISQSNLQAVVDRINRLTNSPMTPYTKLENGKHVANIGNYHLDGAYGGYGLVRMHNDGGGVQSIIGGHMPKRDLYDRMQSFIAGIDAVQS